MDPGGVKKRLRYVSRWLAAPAAARPPSAAMPICVHIARFFAFFSRSCLENTARLCSPAWTEKFVISMLAGNRSEEHTSELQSLMRISDDGLCFKKKKTIKIA